VLERCTVPGWWDGQSLLKVSAPAGAGFYVLIAAEELGTEGGKAYALAKEYDLLSPEAASAAASLRCCTCIVQESLSFVLTAAEELGTEGGKAYALGNEYGFLSSEAASAAASLRCCTCIVQESLSFVLIAAEDRGTEGGEAYALGNEYGLLDPEAASHAAEALNEGLVVAMRPAAEATRDQRPELLGIQAEVHPSQCVVFDPHPRIGPYLEVLVLYLPMRCSRACAF